MRDKEAAKQNIAVAENERPRILTAANTKLKEAQTQANITLNKVRSLNTTKAEVKPIWLLIELFISPIPNIFVDGETFFPDILVNVFLFVLSKKIPFFC